MKKKILIITYIYLYLSSAWGVANEFNIAIASLDLTLNPFYTYTADEAQYLSGIYEGLVAYSPGDLTPQPAMAESWTLSQDKKTYSFKLRKGLQFSNGDKITSETFKNSFMKLLNPETNAEFASLMDIIVNAQEYRNGDIEDFDQVGISTDGEMILNITLKKRAPYFTKILCHHSFTPVHPSLLDQRQWSIDQIIPSGPYTLSRGENSYVLNKNKRYWDSENVYFDIINLLEYSESDKATEDYNLGKVDWLTDSAINLEMISDIETLKVNPLFATTYYYFNPTYKEYKNKEIRNAISLLIPWNKIREKQYIPANSLIPTLSNFPKNSVNIDQDVEKALELLKNSGHNKGKGLSNLIISIPENTYNDKYITDIIKESIETNTEITVTIKTTPYPDFFTINRGSDFAISTLSWIGDFADPLTFLEMWTTNSNLNDSGFSSEEYDIIIEESSNMIQSERYIELSKAEKMLLENSIVIPINHSPGINVIDTRYIGNWYVNTLDIHPYKYLKIVEKQVVPGLI